MLGKMLVHGVIAAAVVGGVAAVYAQVKGNGSGSPQLAQLDVPARSDVAAALTARNDDLRPTWTEARGSDRKHEHSFKSDRHRDRHDRKRDHDDDD